MNEQEEEMKVEALAQTLVRKFPTESILQVISQAQQLEVSAYEKYETVFNSALFEGARLAFLSEVRVEYTLIEMLQKAVNDCDRAIQNVDDEEAVRQIESIRNPITAYFNDQQDKIRSAIVDAMVRSWDIERFLITGDQPVDEIDRETVMTIGSRNLFSHPEVFSVWAAVGDTPMQCNCPDHLQEEFDKRGLTLLQAREICMKKYPTEEEAIEAFGRYLVSYCRRVALATTDDTLHAAVAVTTLGDAGKMANDFLASLRLKSTGEGDNADDIKGS